MKYILTEERTDLPEGVSVELKGKEVTVKGPLGTLKRNFKQVGCKIYKTTNPKTKGAAIGVQMWFAKRKQRSTVTTVNSHIANLIRGVTRGWTYKMRLAYSHFPIQVTVSADKKTMEIKHFLGERNVRKIVALEGVTFEKKEDQKDDFAVKGTDLENVSLTCALIHQSVKVHNKDIRQFLDGIYVSDKRLPLNE